MKLSRTIQPPDCKAIPVNMQGAEGAEYVPMKVGREFRTNETPGSAPCSW